MMINRERVMKELTELGRMGWNPEAGMDRLPFTENYVSARNYVQNLMEKAGMRTRVDPVGNLFGTYEGNVPGLKTLLAGSHLDSVPEGGRYDGPLGVLGALEAARCLHTEGHRHPIEVVAFIAEEGGDMGGTFGSRSFTGAMEMDHLPSDDVMRRLGMSREKIEASRGKMAAYKFYLELHIEQGPILEDTGKNIGIPRAIAGITRYRVSFVGDANHAGTTPASRRQDALKNAVHVLSRWYEYAAIQRNFVSNVGVLSVNPGSPAIIPGQVEFILELRSADHMAVEQGARYMESLIKGPSENSATMTLMVDKNGAELDPTLRSLVASVCAEQRLSWDEEMTSGAMHDAAPLSKVMPSAMIFIPSVGGKSHSKMEYSHPHDVENGVSVLAATLRRLDAI